MSTRENIRLIARAPFILHFGELQSDSSIRYKLTLFENNTPKCYIVKRILVSFNCFSEYSFHILSLSKMDMHQVRLSREMSN